MPIELKIRDYITQFGSIPIDKMMSFVSSDYSNSYYRTTKSIGADSDFITAPEISQLFGEIIGLWVIEKWQKLNCPDEFILVELGPGNGVLMRDLLSVTKLIPDFGKNLQIFLIEINSNFVIKQSKILSIYNRQISWLEKINDIPKLPSIFIANEFFDSLPIKQYVKKNNKWSEIVLSINPFDGMLNFDNIPIEDNLENFFLLDHPEAGDGAIFEESVDSLKIIRFIANHINIYGGCCLIIDYGYRIENRNICQYNSTLQAVKLHKYSPILPTLGEADLTAHVNFLAFEKTLNEEYINNFTFSTQREFLIKYGILLRVDKLLPSVSNGEKIILKKQLDRLINNHGMGSLFKVLEF